jgi:DNA-binding beta-propeller fold protein YncE
VGVLYVADVYNCRIQEFTSNGQFVDTWGLQGLGEGEFRSPVSVAVDRGGNIYVADLANHRIQKFGDLPIPTQPTTWGRIKAEWR